MIEVRGSGEYLRRGLEAIEHLVGEPADVLVLLAYPEILKKEEISRYKAVLNFHAGLPNYRGRHPLQWMLIDGVEQIPVSVHYVDEGIDTGNILVHDYIMVSVNETYATALEKVTRKVGTMMLEAIRRVGEPGERQSKGRYARKRTPEDSRVPMKLPSWEAHRFINALSDPMPNAEINGVKYKWSLWTPNKQIVLTADGKVCEFPI